MMPETQSSVGVISGRFVPGALRTDASEYAKLRDDVPRGIQSLRLSDIDETEATLAWDAAAAVLRDEKIEPKELGGLVVASRDPEETAGFLGRVLEREDLEIQTSGSTRESAAGALTTACTLAESSGAPVLYVAAQDTTWSHRQAQDEEGVVGSGAVALLVGKQAPVALEGQRAVQHSNGPPPVSKILGGLETGEGHVVTVAASSPVQLKRWQKAMGGLRLVPSLMEQVGDLGPVAPAASLLAAVEGCEVGQALSVVVPGGYRTLLLGLRVKETPRLASVKQYLEHAVDTGPVVAERVRKAWVQAQRAEPRGAYVPLSVFRSQDPARLRLVGQKCGECDKLLFPPRERCPHCQAARFSDHGFGGEGSIYSWTRIQKGGAPSEFAPLQSARGAYAVAVVELKEGPRVAAMLTGPALDGSGVSIGAHVRLVPRLVYVQERVPRYSFKALLVAEEDGPVEGG